jgi:hypothetical protein
MRINYPGNNLPGTILLQEFYVVATKKLKADPIIGIRDRQS